MKKKKRKKIDLVQELEGKIVALKTKKEKKLTLTDEINLFLSKEITLNSLKHILIRLQGPESNENIEKSDIKIVAMLDEKGHLANYRRYCFLIFIPIYKKFPVKYYLESYSFTEFSTFGKTIDICTSLLKNKLQHEIYLWLTAHAEDFIIL